MADVFLSYTSDDLPRVLPVIEALEQRGVSVWWGRKIPPGKTYAQVITENLNAAGVVVVVWSEISVQSDWVQIEATKGKRRGVLVPVMIDPVTDDIPLEFSLIEAADLAAWDGSSPHHELEALLGSVGEILSVGTESAPEVEAEHGAPDMDDAVSKLARFRERMSGRPDLGSPLSAGAPRVYLSYRRSDAAGQAGRLHDSLATHLGTGSVFMDVDAIQAGVDFQTAIAEAIESSTTVIPVIGRRWLAAADVNGERRLDDPADFVRMELAAAFERETRVIPVLVQGSHMPSSDELPSDIRMLARLNALELSDEHWKDDVELLIKALERPTS